jgi:hypothetical protein
MDNKRNPNFRRLGIIAVILVILSTVLIFLAQDFIREVFVLPLSYLVWVIGILVNSSSQDFYWYILVVIAAMIAWRSVTDRKKARPLPQHPILDLLADQTSSGRATYWAVKVNLLRTGNGPYYTKSFHNALGHLLIDLLAFRYRMSTRQAEDAIKDGSLDVPAEVREYALDALERGDLPYGNFFDRLWKSINEFVRNFWSRLTANRAGDALTSHPDVVDPRITYILNYMEEELEVPHVESGH